jgi:hypothetical protein
MVHNVAVQTVRSVERSESMRERLSRHFVGRMSSGNRPPGMRNGGGRGQPPESVNLGRGAEVGYPLGCG